MRGPGGSFSEYRERFGRVHILAPVVLLVLGVVAAKMSADLSIGSLNEPQPGLWPFVVSLLIVITGVLLVFFDRAGDYEAWRGNVLRVGAGLMALSAFIVLFQIIGFMFSAMLLLFGWMKLLGCEPWKLSVPLALAGGIALHLLFVELFHVPFPDPLITFVGVS